MAEILASMIEMMRQGGLLYPTYVDLPNSRIFTLLFPSRANNAPIIVYNPGGPGGSGISSVLELFSPYIFVNEDRPSIKKNSDFYDLTSRYHLLYMDIPADTGYSIAKRDDIVYGDQQTTEEAVRVIKAIIRTYKNIVGENPIIDFFGFSYAGKIWPLVAQRLFQDGYKVGGLAIMSGYTHPILQEVRPIMEYLLYSGFISSSDYNILEEMTDRIEELIERDPSGKDWRKTQELYVQAITRAWEIASVNNYNTREPSTVEDPLDKPIGRSKKANNSIDEILDNPLVRKAFGVTVPFYPSASTFGTDTYQGFLTPATDALLYLANKGVFIIYLMGTLDGATLTKGTKDMMEQLFSTKLVEKRWSIQPSRYFEVKDSSDILIGKISQIRPNVYYGTVVGTGHSFESIEGALGFGAAMNYLYERRVLDLF